jgi:uncharacterized protein YndB with AHSA1/START domain
MNARAKHTVEITTPSDCEIVLKRNFDAPRGLVFDALTNADLMKRWMLPPDGWSMASCDIDLRVGGGYRCVWRNNADGTDFAVSGVYREIARPERFVHTEQFEDPAFPGEAVHANTLTENAGQTTYVVTMLFDTKEARDAALASGIADGMAAGYDSMDMLFV